MGWSVVSVLVMQAGEGVGPQVRREWGAVGEGKQGFELVQGSEDKAVVLLASIPKDVCPKWRLSLGGQEGGAGGGFAPPGNWGRHVGE